jgi:acyl-CoA thioesterase FadM
MTSGPDDAELGPPTEDERRVSAPFRVRFDEATPSGLIRTSVLLRFAADLAWVHSERRGIGRAWYRERGLAWLVRGAALELVRPIAYGDVIVGTTQPTGARKVLARRETAFRAADGSTVAKLTVDWALTDATGAPTRIPSIFGTVFGMAGRTFAPIRVRAIPSEETATTTIELPVRAQELDPMGHVNNAVYLDWAEEAIRSNGSVDAAAALEAIPRRWRLEYLGAAAPAAPALATAWAADAGWSVRIVSAATGEPYVGARLEA